MSNAFKVAVLMSTYNGEKYLREQLDSILAQEGVELTLFIRDDGSSDRTIEIIEGYQEEQSCIVLFKGENIGVGNSFMQLVYDASDSYDYYAFSDQDDIWLENKLITAIEKIKEYNSPVLYTSNQLLVDGKGNDLGLRHTSSPGTSYMQILCCNWLSGCTMVWNNSLHKILSDKKRRPSRDMLQRRIHDVWVAMVASVAGEILFDNNAYILYRQHEHNVVGVRKTRLFDEWKKKIRRPELRNGRSYLAEEIIRNIEDLIDTEGVVLQLKKFASCNDSIYSRIKIMNDVKEISKYSEEPELHVVLKVLLGLF